MQRLIMLNPIAVIVEAFRSAVIYGQHPDYTLMQLKAFRAGERQNDSSAMMRSVVERLTDDELSALANYVSGLN